MIQKIKSALIKSKLWKNTKRELLKRKKFTSQIGQDKWVLEKTHFKRGGYFLDIGAADGLYLSNTYILEKKYGWKGICVEPANKIKDLRRNRRCIIENSCIYSKSGELVEFQVDNEISGIKEYFDGAHKRNGSIIYVKTITLKDLLKKYNSPKVIDFLSIDTEGSEYEIIKNFPFKDYEVKLITIEHNAHSGKKEDIKKMADIFNLLTKNGFVREPHHNFSRAYGAEGVIDFEDWYVHKSVKDRKNQII
jgi:FkbM family methyltransferase